MRYILSGNEGSDHKVIFEISPEFVGDRFDHFLVQQLSAHTELNYLSRSKLHKLFEEGAVTLKSGRKLTKGDIIQAVDTVVIKIDNVPAAGVTPDKSVKFSVLYEEAEFAVIDKPAGLVVHPGRSGERQTLAHGLLARFGETLLKVGHPQRPGIVHRLDKDSSGLMVVAKTQNAYKELTSQFLPPRRIHRSYLAITRRPPRGRAFVTNGVIANKISRDPKVRTRMSIKKTGRESVTKYNVREQFQEGLLVELELETGRTHQIRVHLESIGIPILGDSVYTRGMESLSPEVQQVVNAINRHALHAWRLSLEHPTSGERLQFESELPEELVKVLDKLRQ